MSIGPALLWAPVFLATYATLALLRPFGLAIPLDGLAAPFLLSAGVAGIVYATLGAFLCYRSCRLLFAAAPAFWGALVAWLATPAVYYSLISPAYSHATSLFASALFCYVWLKTRGNDRVRRDLWLGILAGLAALVRWQDVIILVLPLFELAWESSQEDGRDVADAALRAGVMVGGMVALLLPQFLAWQAIYGHFLLDAAGRQLHAVDQPGAGSPSSFRFDTGCSVGRLRCWWPWSVCIYLVRRDALVGWSASSWSCWRSTSTRRSATGGRARPSARGASSATPCSSRWGLAALFASDFWQQRAGAAALDGRGSHRVQPALPAAVSVVHARLHAARHRTRRRSSRCCSIG